MIQAGAVGQLCDRIGASGNFHFLRHLRAGFRRRDGIAQDSENVETDRHHCRDQQENRHTQRDISDLAGPEAGEGDWDTR